MSLLSTYNNLKVLLVNKLQSKGITANTSQGMTTLINKIDDIEDTLSTSITGEDISGVYPPNVNVPISSSLKLVYENDDEVSVSAPLENADVTYTFVGANNYYTNTVTTDSNGVASMNFNTSEKDTYTVLVNFLESRPFQAVSDFVLCTLTIFESIIKYFQNISFSNSDGTDSRELSYGDNQSVTMTVQSFEEDNVTVSRGSQVDYLIFTEPITTISYEDAYQLTSYREYYRYMTNEIEDGIYIVPFTVYDSDEIDDMSFSNEDNSIHYVIYYSTNNCLTFFRYGGNERYDIENKIKIKNNALTITALNGTEYTFNSIYSWVCNGKSPYIIQKEITNIYNYEDITLEPNVEYDLTGYDFDIIQLNKNSYSIHNVLKIGQYTVVYEVTDGYKIENRQSINQLRVKNNVLYLVRSSDEVLFNTLTNLKLTAYVSGIVLRKYTDNFEIVDTVLNDNQGISSYEYESQGIGEVYIKAQSHDDPTIQTEAYLISDWVKKDFTGVGNWIAFNGRVNTFSSNTDTVFTQGNGSKGGVHSQNTVFYLPDDDYIVSFKVNNGTIGAGVRIGLHSANYDDHHEKAVIGIENDTSGGFKFDYSTSEVTTVTKVNTNLTQLNTDDLIEFRVVDDTVTFHINGTQYASATLDWLHTPIWLYAQSWSSNNGNFSIKEFRVKRIIGEE